MSKWQQLDNTWKQVMYGAIEAYLENSVPIGAAVVDEHGEIVSVGRNRLSRHRIAHAETESLSSTPASLNRSKASIYSSMEPCPMCTGAIRIMQLKNLHIAARDPAAGSTGLFNATEFMCRFECEVVGPADLTLEFVNVVMMLEHLTRNGHRRWRDNWFAYLPSAVAAGENLAATGLYRTWQKDGSSAQEIYDTVAACLD